ncbi:MAG: hypothetical protein HFJ75_05010 [Eggerthellaceae bacterium]|nr:hypothetical protein [Eggerthellaceae bacterium]
MGIIISSVRVGYKDYNDCFISGVDSAGGAGVRIRLQNDTDKTVKYIKFTLQAINSVGDIVGERNSNSPIKLAQGVGPIEPGAYESYHFEHLWYNGTIASAQLKKVEIQYMDGTTETIENPAIVPENEPDEEKPDDGDSDNTLTADDLYTISSVLHLGSAIRSLFRI